MESHRDEYRPLFGAEITDKPLFGVTNTKAEIANLYILKAIVYYELLRIIKTLVCLYNRCKTYHGFMLCLLRLFGMLFNRVKDRVINLLVGLVTVLLFGVTLLSAFFAKTPPRGLNIYFIICLSLVSLSHVLLIYWYRQGDLDPKFRLLIYYNAFTMVLLSICALSFFFTEY